MLKDKQLNFFSFSQTDIKIVRHLKYAANFIVKLKKAYNN